PRARDRRVRAARAGGDAAGRRRDAAVRRRELLGRGGGGAAPALPLPRPAARAHARRDPAAPPRRARDARVPRRRGLRRDRDAVALALDPGGSARLPRARAARPRLLLRVAAVATALQAAADGLGLRALLPDRPLLP